MISHSPPIFSHSPPVSFLTDYMSNHRQSLNYNDETNRSSRYCRPQVTLASKAMVNNAGQRWGGVGVTSSGGAANRNSSNNGINSSNSGNNNSNTNSSSSNSNSNNIFNNNNYNNNNNNSVQRSFLGRVASMPLMPTQPKSCLSRKSCLHKSSTLPKPARAADAAWPTDASAATADIDTTDCSSEQCRSRKKVIFADDEGLSLTEVRVMSEPSNVPPYWSVKFLEQITQGLVSPHPADQWTVDFKQPASDYLSFRQKIMRDYVSLENVIVKDEESIVVGTVKVKNIDFQKEVIVRVTWDDWTSQQDIFCTYNRAYGPATCAHVIFDTFSFKITLPPSSKRLEFCICFRGNNQEYWDNNDGKNYTISKRSPFYYNALAPYDKTSGRNNCSNQVKSTLTEALAQSNNSQSRNQNWQQEPSPYW